MSPCGDMGGFHIREAPLFIRRTKFSGIDRGCIFFWPTDRLRAVRHSTVSGTGCNLRCGGESVEQTERHGRHEDNPEERQGCGQQRRARAVPSGDGGVVPCCLRRPDRSAAAGLARDCPRGEHAHPGADRHRQDAHCVSVVPGPADAASGEPARKAAASSTSAR